jgi:hypothetical protein
VRSDEADVSPHGPLPWIIDDPQYAHLLQRKDVVVASTGCAEKKSKTVKPELLDVSGRRIQDLILNYKTPEETPEHPLFAGVG